MRIEARIAAVLALGAAVACGSSGSGGGGTGGSAGAATGGVGGGATGGSGGAATGGSGGAATGGSGGAATGGSGGAATGGSGGSATGGSGGATGGAGGAGGSGGGAVPAGTVQGVITRTATLKMPQDGKGTIYVDVGPQCPYTTGFAGAKTATIANADMNDPNVKIPWQLSGITPGTYAVWGWLDDNGDTIPSTPFPSGDPANSTCVTVTVTATQGATADLLFNSVI